MSSLFNTDAPVLGYNLERVPAFTSGNSGLEGKKIISLASNESQFVPPHVLKAIQKSAHYSNVYVDPTATALRHAIGEAYDLNPEHVVVVRGGEDGIGKLPMITQRVVTRTGYGGFKYGVGTFEYDYGRYRPGAIAAGKAFSAFPQTFKAYGEHFVKVNSPVEKLGYFAQRFRTDLVLLSNPQNPLGAYMDINRYTAGLESLPKGVIGVADSAYVGFAESCAEQKILDLSRKHPNILFMQTFSKFYRMAGEEVAFIHSSNLPLVQALRKTLNLFSISQAANAGALAALQHRDLFAGWAQQTAGFRETLKTNAWMTGFKVLIGDHENRGGNFFSFWCPNQQAAPQHKALWAENVMVFFQKKGFQLRHLGQYGLPDVIRISMPGEKHLPKVISVFEQLVDKAGKLPSLNWSHFTHNGKALTLGLIAGATALWASFNRAKAAS